ncbi:hypothetical protein LTR86_003827 [Recurvomyces mirabilis]|nr:hypothetical protein LTR86_003827 [Recurvomyces mirabilis]
MSSISLGPDDRPQFTRFVENQFKTKLVPPPKNLTFNGQTAVITGSNVGIGLECARVMVEHHISFLILAVRSKEKGETAARQMRQKHAGVKIEVWPLDMLDYDSCCAFAKRCDELPRLDIAILNAGLAKMAWNINDSTGHEEVFQVNYLSTALLSLLLLPVLKKTASVRGQPSRLTIVSSFLGCVAAFKNRDSVPLLPSFDQLDGKFGIAEHQERYSVSKTLSLMLTFKLGEVVDPSEVIVNAVEPGYTKGTGLQREVKGVVFHVILWLLGLAARSPRQAAWTYIDAVGVQGKGSHGSFLMNFRNMSYPSMMYKQEGRQVVERLWEETLDELDFANVKAVVGGSDKDKS